MEKLWVRVGAAALRAYSVGRGRPVVFLHAGVADSRMWDHQLSGIGQHAKAVAYDRRGFGETPASSTAYNQTGDLFAVLEDVAPDDPAVLVGCSQGGRIAIDAALARAQRVAALVLIAPAISGAPTPVFLPEIAAQLATLEAAEQAGDLDAVNAIEARLWLDGPLEPPGRVAGAARDCFLAMNRIALAAVTTSQAAPPPSAYEHLEAIAAPTLVAWGTLDFPQVKANAETLVRRIPGARGHGLPGAAHLPSMEMPEATTELIREFIGGLENRRQLGWRGVPPQPRHTAA